MKYGGGRKISLLEKIPFKWRIVKINTEINLKGGGKMFGIAINIVQIVIDIVLIICLVKMLKTK